MHTPFKLLILQLPVNGIEHVPLLVSHSVQGGQVGHVLALFNYLKYVESVDLIKRILAVKNKIFLNIIIF